MTVLAYRTRHRQFRRIRRVYVDRVRSNLVIKRWPNRWLRKRARVQPFVLRRSKIRYPIAGPPARFVPKQGKFRIKIKRGKRFTRKIYSIAGPPVGYIAYKRTPFLRPKVKRGRRFTRKIYSIAGPPARFIAFKRPPRPRIKRGKRFPRAKGVFLQALLLFLARRRVKIKRARLRLKSRLYSIAGPPAGFVPAKRMFRVRIKRGRRFVRKVYPILPQTLLLFARFKRPKVRRRVLRMGPRRYSIAGPPVGFIAYKRLPAPKIRRKKSFLRKLFPFLPVGPLIWQKPRFLRPKIKRGRKFAIKHPYTTPPTPASFVAYRPFPRAKVKRPKISLRRFQLRYYEFPGVAPVVNKVVDWLIRARRRGRR